jgi:hypothetical protein
MAHRAAMESCQAGEVLSSRSYPRTPQSAAGLTQPSAANGPRYGTKLPIQRPHAATNEVCSRSDLNKILDQEGTMLATASARAFGAPNRAGWCAYSRTPPNWLVLACSI